MKKIAMGLLVALFSMQAFAQTMNPADVADRFMICSDTTQTQQLIVMLDAINTPKGGTYIKTDVPGSQNVQEMVQLSILTADFDDTQLTIEAQSIIDANRTFSIHAQAFGEQNISPTTKTLVYIGQMQTKTTSENYMCVVLEADELSGIMPQ